MICAGILTLSLVAGTVSRALAIQASRMAAATPIMVRTAPVAAAPSAPANAGSFETESFG